MNVNKIVIFAADLSMVFVTCSICSSKVNVATLFPGPLLTSKNGL